MGLRINTNLSALTALRTLGLNERNQAKSLERLSTGLQINRASDDPSGLIIAEELRAQLRALGQAVDNSQNAANLVSVADSALSTLSGMLLEMTESIVFAQNTGGASPAQIAAEQDGIDNAIAAIDRVAATTRYSDRELLNGTAGYQLVSDRPSEIQNLRFRSITFGSGEFTQNFTIEVDTMPQRGDILLADVSSPASATVRLTGPRGTADVRLASGAVASNIARAINSVAAFTGVYASAGTGAAADVRLNTEGFGREQIVSMEIVDGTVEGAASILQDDTSLVAEAGPFGQGEVLFDRGSEGVVVFDGQRFEGVGLDFNILTRVPIMEFGLNPDLFGSTIVSGSTFTFTVANTGLSFQLNELPSPTDRLAVGIESMVTSLLGFEPYRDKIEEAIANPLSPNLVASPIQIGGFISSLKTGGGNDLFQNPSNAHHIVRAALEQVNTLRAHLGAAVANSIEPNIESLGVAIENLSASLSDIRDLDFAEETANFVKSQILFQSGIGVLASANAVPQSVLTLLGL